MSKFQQAKEDIKTRSSDMKKAIKIYTIELLVFSAIFITLGILELLGIIGNNLDWRLVFTYITLVGVTLFVAFNIWSFVDPKRRAKVDVIDRVMLIPGPIAVLVLDIITLIKGTGDPLVMELHKYIIGCVFIYFGACYIFQAIYHYYFPSKMLVEMEEKAKLEALEEAAAEEPSETPSELPPEEKEEEKQNEEEGQ